jgi:hypothetical protein
MKASELRIGNWFENTNGSYHKVTYHEIRYASIHPDDSYKAIPLTEEWLVRFGFVSGKNSAYTYMWGFYIVFDNEGIYFRHTDINRDLAKIQYVHQLQNLYFALTGEELILKYEKHYRIFRRAI